MNRLFRLGGGLVFAALATAQNPAATAARDWRQAHEQAILTEFTDLLSIPNVAADFPNIHRNAEAVSAMLGKRGVATRMLEIAGAPPVVYGEIRTPGAQRTIVFYAHYDGQPLDPKEWSTEPWKPAVRDSRIYARSASDDKAAIIAIATALDAIHAGHLPIRSNLKFVFEGEEEAGSPHLARIIEANRDLLGGDVWLICDGPVHQSRRQQIVFGARGIQIVDITVYGPQRELHSGHYGNWAQNPAMMLARLLASMKDDEGRVLVKDFYKGIEPLSDTERRAIAEAPDVETDLEHELWLHGSEGGRTILEALALPTLNVRGMASARVGKQASNVVPSTATATIDMRLVKAILPEQATARLTEHIRAQGYFVVDHEPGAEIRMAHSKVAKVIVEPGGYRAVRTSMDLPISRLVLATAATARGPIMKLPTMGGSVPLFAIEDILHAPTITVPIANHDNNQHAANENLRIQNLWDGIELMAALLAM